MERKKEWKFICLSLLMAGAGMLVTACSSDDEDPVKKETREGGEVSNTNIVVSDTTNTVVLDADTLQVFKDYSVKFQLLNSENLPVATFKEGVNFTFALTVINSGNGLLELPIDAQNMEFFPIYADDSTYLGLPWDYITQFGIGVAYLNPKESISFTCKAFGERDDDTDLSSSHPKIAFLKTTDKSPLPKGKYYTEFELKFNNEGEGVICKKAFTIE